MRQSEWEKEKAIHILELVRSELYMDMPHFLTALNTLVLKEDERVAVCATNGVYFYYNPLKIIDLFQKNAVFLNRSFLHSVLHCLYSHIWLRKNRVEFIWNVACDIIVEYTLDSMHKKSVSRILSYVRKDVYREIESLTGISCITVYEWLCTRDDIQDLYYEFVVDDHTSWPKEQDDKIPQSSSVQKSGRVLPNKHCLIINEKGKIMRMGMPFLCRVYRQRNRNTRFLSF